jgi:hypothetical protein
MKTPFLVLALLIAPLGAAAQESTAPEVRACTVTVPGTDLTGWREVQASGFTFCVPANWRPAGRGRGGVDARTWRGGGGEVKWGAGKYRSARVVTRVVTVRAGNPLPQPNGVNRFAEVIGGSAADLWNNELEGDFFTGAQWNRPEVYLAGESRDAVTARLQLQVFRTVRFSQP